jgi:ATP-dependent Clp protease protease subunit
MLLKLNEAQFNNKNPVQSFYMLYDEVSLSTAKEMTQWIMDANFTEDDRPEVLNLMVNSPGGDMNAAFAIIDVMRGSHIPVRTLGLGQIASAGLMIFIAGKAGHRVLTQNTSIMSHTWSWGHVGKSHELIAATREYDLTSERMLEHYKKCTKMSEKDVKKYLLPPQDVYLNAEEALKYGICDEITKLK